MVGSFLIRGGFSHGMAVRRVTASGVVAVVSGSGCWCLCFFITRVVLSVLPLRFVGVGESSRGIWYAAVREMDDLGESCGAHFRYWSIDQWVVFARVVGGRPGVGSVLRPFSIYLFTLHFLRYTTARGISSG